MFARNSLMKVLCNQQKMCASKSTERAMLAQEEGRDHHGRVKFCPFCFTSCFFFVYVCRSGAVCTRQGCVCPLAHCGGLKRTFTKTSRCLNLSLSAIFLWTGPFTEWKAVLIVNKSKQSCLCPQSTGVAGAHVTTPSLLCA